MENWHENAVKLVGEMIDLLRRNSSLKPLMEAVRHNKTVLTKEVDHLLAEERGNPAEREDRARSYLIHSGLGYLQAELGMEHFLLFKKAKPIQLILEYAFEEEGDENATVTRLTHQQEVIRIIANCLFRNRRKRIHHEDIESYLHWLFGARNRGFEHDDRTMRYRSMLWFAYLCIEIVNVDAASICTKDVVYFSELFQNLLRSAMDGILFKEKATASPQPDYKQEKWEGTLFHWMREKEAKPFVEKLWRQFNWDKVSTHGNRLLLAAHRNCMYRQARELFC